MRRLFISLLLPTLAAGCLTDNSKFCDESSGARPGQWCDTFYNRWMEGTNPNADMSVVDLTPPPDLTIICTGSADCTDPAAPICNMGSKKCVPCSAAAATDAGTSDECSAKMNGQPFCVNGACVECAGPSDCLAKQKTCSPTGACVACKKNAECTSGLCVIAQGMSEGSCEKPENVTYVNVNRCTGNKGTFAEPYCKLQDAIKAMGGKPIVVAKGNYKEDLVVDASKQKMSATVIGLEMPRLEPASPTTPVLELKGDSTNTLNITLDDFTIAGAIDADGVVCTGAPPASNTKLSLLRSKITGNTKTALAATTCDVTLDQDEIGPNNLGGGLLMASSDFSVLNTLIFRNGSPTGSTAVSNFGGLKFSIVPARAVIFNATIVANSAGNAAQTSGVECAGARIAMANTVVFDNKGGKAQVNADVCRPDHSAFPNADAMGSGTGNQNLTNCSADMLFTKPRADEYLPLKGGVAPCTLIGEGIESFNGVTVTPYDLAGNPRPGAGGYDIGAYEAQ